MENCNVIVVKFYDDENHIKQESCKILINDDIKLFIDGNFVVVLDGHDNVHVGNRLYFRRDDELTEVKTYFIQTENGALSVNNINYIAVVDNNAIILDDCNDITIKRFIELVTI